MRVWACIPQDPDYGRRPAASRCRRTIQEPNDNVGQRGFDTVKGQSLINCTGVTGSGHHHDRGLHRFLLTPRVKVHAPGEGARVAAEIESACLAGDGTGRRVPGRFRGPAPPGRGDR